MTTKSGKHTPGPWQIARYGDNERPVIVRGEERIARDMSEANAHLIASAPDMKRCIEHLLANCMPNNGKEAVIEYAIEVLKKAEGRV